MLTSIYFEFSLSAAQLKWEPHLKGSKLNERPGTHSDNYGILGFLFPHEKFTSYSLLYYRSFDCNVSTFSLVQNGSFLKIAESDLLEIHHT